MKYWTAFPLMDVIVESSLPEDRGFRPALQRPGEVVAWSEPNLVLPEDVVLRDCHPGVNYSIYSRRLRDVIDGELGEADEIQWLPARLEVAEAEQQWWVCNPLTGPDALDEEFTTREPSDAPEFIRNKVIKATYDLAKIGDRQLLKYPYGADPVMSDRLRAAIEEAGCTGIHWRPMPVVDRRASA